MEGHSWVMSYLTTQRARVFCFCYSEVCSVALSLYTLACFCVWRGRYGGRGVGKDGAWHWVTSLYCCTGCYYKSQKWNRRRWAPNANLALLCTLTFIPCPFPNYVALPKGMIIISSGAKMTHLHLLFEKHHILSSGLKWGDLHICIFCQLFSVLVRSLTNLCLTSSGKKNKTRW